MSDDFAADKQRFGFSPARRRSSRVCALRVDNVRRALGARDSRDLEWTFFKEQYLGLFFALVLTSIFITVKARSRPPDE